MVECNNFKAWTVFICNNLRLNTTEKHGLGCYAYVLSSRGISGTSLVVGPVGLAITTDDSVFAGERFFAISPSQVAFLWELLDIDYGASILCLVYFVSVSVLLH